MLFVAHLCWTLKDRSLARFNTCTAEHIYVLISSGVYKNIGNEVAVVTAVATFIVIYNALARGYVDFDGVQHEAVIQGLPKLGLPLTPFTLSSPSLGLLLGTLKQMLETFYERLSWHTHFTSF